MKKMPLNFFKNLILFIGMFTALISSSTSHAESESRALDSNDNTILKIPVVREAVLLNISKGYELIKYQFVKNCDDAIVVDLMGHFESLDPMNPGGGSIPSESIFRSIYFKKNGTNEYEFSNSFVISVSNNPSDRLDFLDRFNQSNESIVCESK